MCAAQLESDSKPSGGCALLVVGVVVGAWAQHHSRWLPARYIGRVGSYFSTLNLPTYTMLSPSLCLQTAALSCWNSNWIAIENSLGRLMRQNPE